MTRDEMLIKRFENRYPHIVVLISEWEEWSLHENWDNLQILLNEHTVPNCPEDKFDESIGYNKRYKFFKDLSEEVTGYLSAKCGYKAVGQSYPKTVKCPDGYRSGWVVTAYIDIPKNLTSEKR